MLIFWFQKGNKTMKRTTEVSSEIISIEEARHECDLLKKLGHRIVYNDFNITVE